MSNIASPKGAETNVLAMLTQTSTPMDNGLVVKQTASLGVVKPGQQSAGGLTPLISSQALCGEHQRLFEEMMKLRNSASKHSYDILSQNEQQARQALQTVQQQQDLKTKKYKPDSIRGKVRSGLEKFCEVALYYQNAFDCMNDLAPEYTTIPWGAVKLLLLYPCNQQDLRNNVQTHLEQIGSWLEDMEVVSRVQREQRIIDAVTKTHTSFMVFLKEALKFYNEGSFKKALKTMTAPWKFRFESLVNDIEENYKRVKEIADTFDRIDIKETNIIVKDNTADLKDMKEMLYVQPQMLAQLSNMMKAGHISNEELLGKLFSEIGQLRGDMSNEKEANIDPRELLSWHLNPKNGSGPLRFRNRVFQELQDVEDPLAPILMDVCAGYEQSPYEAARANDLHRNKVVLQWLGQESSNFLWIEGRRTTQGLVDPATDLSARIASAASSQFPQAKDDSVTGLYYFCGRQQDSQKIDRPRVILQSLIYSLIANRSDAFTPAICEKLDLTQTRFTGVSNSLPGLVRLFKDCVKVLTSRKQPGENGREKKKTIFVVIDCIEVVHSICEQDKRAKRDFKALIDFLRSVSEENEYIGRVLVTSRQPIPPSIVFEESAGYDPRRHYHIRMASRAGQHVAIMRAPHTPTRIDYPSESTYTRQVRGISPSPVAITKAPAQKKKALERRPTFAWTSDSDLDADAEEVTRRDDTSDSDSSLAQSDTEQRNTNRAKASASAFVHVGTLDNSNSGDEQAGHVSSSSTSSSGSNTSSSREYNKAKKQQQQQQQQKQISQKQTITKKPKSKVVAPHSSSDSDSSLPEPVHDDSDSSAPGPGEQPEQDTSDSSAPERTKRQVKAVKKSVSPKTLKRVNRGSSSDSSASERESNRSRNIQVSQPSASEAKVTAITQASKKKHDSSDSSD